eukprot:1000984-Prorocentrum_minimum.AAC.2
MVICLFVCSSKSINKPAAASLLQLRQRELARPEKHVRGNGVLVKSLRHARRLSLLLGCSRRLRLRRLRRQRVRP